MSLLQISLGMAVLLLSITVVLAFVRLLIGPSLPDRVVALDLMSTVGIGAVAVYAIATRAPVFLDVASVLALVSFLGVIAFAYYVAKRGQAEELSREQSVQRIEDS
ncbi:cation:proton antiporter [Desulfoferrobacter suflitae]|uniref:cation:proton antiporter n=1 Tax=Desulfoferrobacter suflitae TaxID=2865782 RepID=UPI00216406E6|nr:cation:proton antiporter [Desulfoferrobacter suflitae]MCK8600370.1 cation:proton antiporter [Desulfoferrobacter suflitae]